MQPRRSGVRGFSVPVGMPSRPSTFRPVAGPGSDADRRARRQDYDRRRRDESATRPLYGTARWQRRRAHQLAIEPLCRMCFAEGVVCVATVADHIEAHRGDVERFWSGALQSLCAPHHNAVKQAEERSATRGPGGGSKVPRSGD